MTALSPGQIAYLAQQAGFSGDGLVSIVAISEAESGGRPDALGDLTLQDGTWGPSVGLTQIRSLKAQYGTAVDDTRDQLANLDPLTNLKHAFQISQAGTNFQPWSTWWGNARARTGPGRGVFQNFLPAAAAAAGQPVPVTSADTSSTGTATSSGASVELASWWNPLDWGSDLGKSIAVVVINGLFYAAGLALVVLGVYKTADPGGSVKGQLSNLAPLAMAAA